MVHEITIHDRRNNTVCLDFTSSFTIEDVLENMGAAALIQCASDGKPIPGQTRLTSGPLTHDHYAVVPLHSKIPVPHNTTPYKLLNPSNAFVYGIGTSTPPPVRQDDILTMVLEQCNVTTDQQRQWITALYNSTAIEQRALLHDPTKHPISELKNIENRNKLYMEHAPKFALEAARKALEEACCPVADITHVVTASCTGVLVPDINFLMIEALGLSPNIERVSVNYMGCFAGLTALKTARALASLHPQKNRVLVICTELCSIHASGNTSRLDVIIGCSLFADGSAAFVVGCEPRPHEKPIYEIVHTATCAIPNTVDLMSWEMTQDGWLLSLSPEIPKAIYKNLTPFVKRLLDEARESSAVQHTTEEVPQDSKNLNFALHPGGKAIISSISKVLGLTDTQTEASYHVLKNYGNMSGASIIFTLDELRKRAPLPGTDGWCCALTFGPGLSAEGAVLKFCPKIEEGDAKM